MIEWMKVIKRTLSMIMHAIIYTAFVNLTNPMLGP